MKTNIALDTLMGRLGNRKEPTLRAACLSEMNLTIASLESGPFLPWFLEKEEILLTVEDQNYVELPADFLQEYEEGLPYVEGAECELVKCSYEEFQAEYRNSTATDQPIHYAIFGTKLYLGPTPDDTYSIRLPYLRKTAELVDDITESPTWMTYAPDLVISKAGETVADFRIQNTQLSSSFANRATFLRNELFKASEMRKHTNVDYTLSRV